MVYLKNQFPYRENDFFFFFYFQNPTVALNYCSKYLTAKYGKYHEYSREKCNKYNQINNKKVIHLSLEWHESD